MATILEVSCRQCGLQHTQLDGPLFAGYRPRCERCGEARLVAFADHLDGPAPPGQEPDLESWAIRQAGTCSCGGRFAAVATLRCSACRSPNVTTAVVGAAD